MEECLASLEFITAERKTRGKRDGGGWFHENVFRASTSGTAAAAVERVQVMGQRYT